MKNDIDNKYAEFRNEIENSKTPLMFYDSDCDGTTSYFQIKKTWKKVRGFSFAKDRKYQLERLSEIPKECDLLIFFDIPDISTEFLEHCENIKIIWQDHHQITDKLKSKLKKFKNINYLNPLNFDCEDNSPSSFLAYKITNDLSNIEFCMLGNLADFFLMETLIDFEKFNKKLFKKIFNMGPEKKREIFQFIKKYKFNDKETYEKRKEYILFLSYKTNFYKLKNFIDFLFKLKQDKIDKATNLISKLSLEEIYTKLDLEEVGFPFGDYLELTKECNKVFDSFNNKLKLKNSKIKKGERKYLNLNYKSKFSFTKTLIEKVVSEFRNYEIYSVYKNSDKGDYVRLSFRSNGEIDLVKLIEKCLIGLKGYGGGHKFAAGVSIKKFDFDKFIENINENF